MKHLVIPDTQIRPGDDLSFLRSIGNYIVDKKPDRIIHLGDFADMPSLSSYDVGKKTFEGRRYRSDIEAAHQGMETLLGPIKEYNSKMRRTKHAAYVPEFFMLYGNHEERILRAVNGDPKLDGTIGLEDLRYKDYGWNVIPFLQPIVLDGVAYCFSFGERVMCADFTHKPVEFVEKGDKLVGFDEEGPTRRYKTTVVEDVSFDWAPVFRVDNSADKSTTVTADHLWLVRPYSTKYQWMRTDELKPGYEILTPFVEYTRSSDGDMNWLGGIIDGEGWLSKSNEKQGGIQIGIAQNDGIVFDKICCVLAKHKFQFEVRKNSTGNNKIRILGSLNEKLRLLIQTNAIRLLAKLSPEMFGRLQTTGNNTLVTNIVPCGEKKIVKIKTDSGTLIVNGQAHHNCHYFVTGMLGRPCSSAAIQLAKKHMSCISGHQQGLQFASAYRADGRRLTSIIAGSCYEHDEDYLGPQGNNHWRGIIVLHDVNDGEFDIMPVALKYLKNKYAD